MIDSMQDRLAQLRTLSSSSPRRDRAFDLLKIMSKRASSMSCSASAPVIGPRFAIVIEVDRGKTWSPSRPCEAAGLRRTRGAGPVAAIH